MSRSWSAAALAKLVRLYRVTKNEALAKSLSRSMPAIRSKAKVLGLTKDNKKIFWTADQIAWLVALYPDNPSALVAQALNISLCRVNQQVCRMRLHKSPEYLASPDSCRLRRGDNIGAAYRFQKGLVPWNKGIKGENYLGCRATQFKKGQKPHTWLPIGSFRYSKEGYLQVKTQDTGYPPRDWRALHLVLWEWLNGPMPAKHVLRFRDGDKANIDPDNFELISFAENMLRNTIHNYPAEIKDVIRITAKLKRKIHEKQTGRPA